MTNPTTKEEALKEFREKSELYINGIWGALAFDEWFSRIYDQAYNAGVSNRNIRKLHYPELSLEQIESALAYAEPTGKQCKCSQGSLCGHPTFSKDAQAGKRWWEEKLDEEFPSINKFVKGTKGEATMFIANCGKELKAFIARVEDEAVERTERNIERKLLSMMERGRGIGREQMRAECLLKIKKFKDNLEGDCDGWSICLGECEELLRNIP